MRRNLAAPSIPLPAGWPRRVCSTLLCVIALAQYAAATARGQAARGRDLHARWNAEADRLRQELDLLHEELRLKDARLSRVPPQRRPHYQPAERMAILEQRAARGWSLQQTADVFHVMAATIASWHGRVDEQGPQALVQFREPVNRFPDFVRYVVQRLKVLFPGLAKVKIAQVLARAGLHVAPATVGRMSRSAPGRNRPPASGAPSRGA
jgi:hypothetical protein